MRRRKSKLISLICALLLLMPLMMVLLCYFGQITTRQGIILAWLAVLVLGESRDMSGEAKSRAFIHIPDIQLKLLDAVLETGTPVVLLISALLTAGYLLPITVNGFLPGADYDYSSLEKKEPNLTMLIPLLILAALAVVLGLFPNPLTEYITGIVAGVL